jgi:hypothetical protein
MVLSSTLHQTALLYGRLLLHRLRSRVVGEALVIVGDSGSSGRRRHRHCASGSDILGIAAAVDLGFANDLGTGLDSVEVVPVDMDVGPSHSLWQTYSASHSSHYPLQHSHSSHSHSSSSSHLRLYSRSPSHDPLHPHLHPLTHCSLHAYSDVVVSRVRAPTSIAKRWI